jgi:hypothetical protein
MIRFRALVPALLLLPALLAKPAISEAAAVRRENVAPVITGTPAPSVVAGNRYTFRPGATDANGDSIRFRISGKPAWGTFSRTTGEFTGIAPLGVNETFANIVIAASDGKLVSSLPPFSIRVTSAVANSAPTISGSPLTSVAASAAYLFTPTASDPNGDAISFSIQNKPSWAIFSIATGQLSGTAPLTSATSSGIVISVSDGSLSTALPSFSLSVVGATSGTASLSWMPPTSNTDGSALTDLSGYRLHFGSSPASLTQSRTIAGAATTTYELTNLSAGNWYFALSANTTSGVESELSTVVSKAIP